MGTLISAGTTMGILFVTVAAGYLARKLSWIGEEFDGSLSKIIMYITLSLIHI